MAARRVCPYTTNPKDEMKLTKAIFALAAVVSLVAVPGQLAAQQMIDGTYTGGNNFATTMSVDLSYLEGTITLEITNNGPGHYTEVALVNIPAGVSVTQGAETNGWDWGLKALKNWDPSEQEGYNNKQGVSPEDAGLSPGQTLTFSFETGLSAADYALVQNIGVAVHAQAGPGGCSAKFAVWNGGSNTSDAGPDYDPDCVDVLEPMSSGLLAVGLAGLVFVANRRREDLELVN